MRTPVTLLTSRAQSSGDCNVERKAALLKSEGVAIDVLTRRIVHSAALMKPDDFTPNDVARALAFLGKRDTSTKAASKAPRPQSSTVPQRKRSRTVL